MASVAPPGAAGFRFHFLVALLVAVLLILGGWHLSFPFVGTALAIGVLFLGARLQWNSLALTPDLAIRLKQIGIFPIAAISCYIVIVVAVAGFELPRKATYQMQVTCTDATLHVVDRAPLEVRVDSLNDIWIGLVHTRVTFPFVDLHMVVAEKMEGQENKENQKGNEDAKDKQSAIALASGELSISPLHVARTGKALAPTLLVFTPRRDRSASLRLYAPDNGKELTPFDWWGGMDDELLTLKIKPHTAANYIELKLFDEYDLFVQNAIVQCGAPLGEKKTKYRYEETHTGRKAGATYRIIPKDTSGYIKFLASGFDKGVIRNVDLHIQPERDGFKYIAVTSGSIKRLTTPRADAGKLAISKQERLDFDKSFLVGAKVEAHDVTQVVKVDLQKEGLSFQVKGESSVVSVESQNFGSSD